MIEFLSDPIWQGIGVIVPLLMAILGFIFRRRKQHKNEENLSAGIIHLPITAEKEILEGQLVRLKGKIWREMFPGPPNYTSIDEGDEPEAYWILNTKDPIEILGKSFEDESLYSVGSSARFQLMLDSNFFKNKAHTVFSDAWVEGKVMIGHTGHHKTKALINVQRIEPI